MLESDSGVSLINLTGSDDQKEDKSVPKKSEFSSMPTHSNPIALVPWKVGPTPLFIWSSKKLNGVPIKTYSQLKNMINARPDAFQ